MLGSQTQAGRMEGADESTELWRHPLWNFFIQAKFNQQQSWLVLTPNK